MFRYVMKIETRLVDHLPSVEDIEQTSILVGREVLDDIIGSTMPIIELLGLEEKREKSVKDIIKEKIRLAFLRNAICRIGGKETSRIFDEVMNTFGVQNPHSEHSIPFYILKK